MTENKREIKKTVPGRSIDRLQEAVQGRGNDRLQASNDVKTTKASGKSKKTN